MYHYLAFGDTEQADCRFCCLYVDENTEPMNLEAQIVDGVCTDDLCFTENVNANICEQVEYYFDENCDVYGECSGGATFTQVCEGLEE